MRDAHGQDRPLAGAAGGGPADRGGDRRPLDRGVGPGECYAPVWIGGVVARFRWPCGQRDAAYAVDFFDLDALAGRRPSGGAGDDHQRPVDPGADGAAADLDAGTVPLADAHAGTVVGGDADRGTIDLGDWPSLI
jgi:hypothetical protein